MQPRWSRWGGLWGLPLFTVALVASVPSIVTAASPLRLTHRSLRAGAGSHSRGEHSYSSYSGSNSTVGNLGKLPSACGVSVKVNAQSDKYQRCPMQCPLYAEVITNNAQCDFQCVGASTPQCASVNAEETVVDLELGVCRPCRVAGCDVCSTDGRDSCAKCNTGYNLVNGACKSQYLLVWYSLAGGLGLIVIIVVAWVVDLGRREITNANGLKHALEQRSRAKLRMPKDTPDNEGQESSSRQLWPLMTNLLTTRVAGPGIMLQANFQAMIILWAIGVAVAWACLAYFVDNDLFIMGKRQAATPRENCIVVAWGHDTQQRLMWTKVLFTVALYVVSFFLAVAFSVRQLRVFQRENIRYTTHKDFCAKLTGLPALPGTDYVEEELKDAVQPLCNGKVVGVSVCWDYEDHEDTLLNLIDSDMFEREAAVSGVQKIAAEPITEEAPMTGASYWKQVFHMMEHTFMSPKMQKLIKKGRHRDPNSKKKRKSSVPELDSPKKTPRSEADPSDAVVVDVDEVLRTLTTCDTAFVVFETEVARDDAVEAAKKTGGFEFKGSRVELFQANCEPDTMRWNFCGNSRSLKIKRICGGIACILFALTVWVVAFYLPYAYFVMSFDYAYGQEPGLVAGMTFSMLVVLGNALMYVACSEVADRVGFRYLDDREVCYMLLYSFACILNVVLDLACTYLVAYQMMVGSNMRTFDGRHLREVTSFTERFETYAMQRNLAQQLWMYSFPSTFLIPFLLEPLITIYVPYKVMSLIIRSHTEFKGPKAEGYLASTQMDLSRYADLLLNVMLVVLVFYFPGGYTIQMFLALAFSHLVIFAYDHCRVLRLIPKSEFASMKVDWWAQWFLCIPCGLLLSCACMKSNCEPGFHCWSGMELLCKCSAAFVCHVTLHTLVLLFVVPWFGLREEPPSNESFKKCAQRIACSWFTSNPVHCLRSTYVYHHDPPCDFCVAGKEHLLRVNKAIGCYFSDQVAEAEDFTEGVDVPELIKRASSDVPKYFKQVSRDLSGKLSGMLTTGKGSDEPQ
mmetsp:Transcript_45030/g.96089  ORF Transcript_45030/g.96089 Transcript_45030/m.96089 type:complete len:1022 (-) Transcript_45030:216-3281(-)